MEHGNLGPIKAERKTGQERFHLNGQNLDFSLLDFWQWSSSDLLGNALRGLLAEYIVGQAINTTGHVRQEWHMVDLETRDGRKIEVKSAAYLQSWSQVQHSKIRFGIAPTIGWNADTNEYATERKRQADIYVFALLHHRDKATIDPMNINQWSFFVVPTARLDSAINMQASIGLSAVQQLAGHEMTYAELASALS